MSEEQTLDELEAELLELADEEAEEEESVDIDGVLSEDDADTEEEAEEEDSDGSDEEEAEETNEAEEESDAEAEKEEVVKEESKVEQPDNAAFAKMRREAKELKRKLAEAEKLAQEKSASDLGRTVGQLAKAWENGGDDKALVAKVRASSAQELSAIYDEALTGKYGDQTDEVINVLERAMPMAERRERARSKTAEAQRQKLVEEYNAELEDAKEIYPDLVTEEGEKFLKEVDSRLIGYNEKTGEFAGALSSQLAGYLESHPLDHYQMVSAMLVAKKGNSDVSASQVKDLRNKIKVMEKELRKFKGLESPSAAKKAGSSSEMTLEEMEAEIIAAGRN